LFLNTLVFSMLWFFWNLKIFFNIRAIVQSVGKLTFAIAAFYLIFLILIAFLKVNQIRLLKVIWVFRVTKTFDYSGALE